MYDGIYSSSLIGCIPSILTPDLRYNVSNSVRIIGEPSNVEHSLQSSGHSDKLRSDDGSTNEEQSNLANDGHSDTSRIVSGFLKQRKSVSELQSETSSVVILLSKQSKSSNDENPDTSRVVKRFKEQ